jgi:chromosome segregation ATPase
LHVGHDPNLLRLRRANEELASIQRELSSLEAKQNGLKLRQARFTQERDMLLKSLQKVEDLATDEPADLF